MKNVMMISFDLPPLSMWGVAKHVNHIVKLLRGQFNLEVVSQSKHVLNENVTIVSDKYSDCLIQSIFLPFDSYTDFDYLQSWNYLLAKKIIAETTFIPDIIHNHNWMTFPAAKIVAKHFGSKLVSTVHFLEKQYNNIYSTLPIDSTEIINVENDIFKYSDRIILLGKNQRNFVLCNYECVPNKISIIPHGLSIIEQNSIKTIKDKVSLLFVGRLVKEKGIVDLISVVKKLQKKFINISLHIAGKGPLSIGPFLNDSFIKYHGFLEESELYKLYRNSDIFCFPSYTETFGLVSIEAAMHSLPIITSTCKNVEELFLKDEALFVDIDFKDGISFLNQKQLYFNIKKLITQPSLYSYYSRKARIASLRYDENYMIEHLTNLYNKLLE